MEQTNLILTDPVIADCDIAIWGVYVEDGEERIMETYMKASSLKNPISRTVTGGYRYNVLYFKECTDADISVFTATIGDPHGYIRRMSELGYHGVLCKTGLKPTKRTSSTALKNLLNTFLKTGWGFKKSQLTKIVKDLLQ